MEGGRDGGGERERERERERVNVRGLNKLIYMRPYRQTVATKFAITPSYNNLRIHHPC